MSGLQQRVQERIDALVDRGAETGVQVAVHQHGAVIVDAVAGTADPATGRPLTTSTPIFSFSTAKNVAAVLCHLLVARGFLDYDTRVTDLWPEFGAHGKDTATLRHVLTHTVGVPAMPRAIAPADLPDWPRVCAAIAAAKPRWRPGTRTGYHSYTFGYLVGELARRATGRPVHELLHEWITAPLGIEGELYFATPRDALPGLARLQPDASSWPATAADGCTGHNRTDHEPVLAQWESRPSTDLGNDEAILRADIPSVGVATARGLATMFTAVLQGQLLGQRQLADLSAVAFDGVDQVFGAPARLALGFPVGRIGTPAAEGSVAFGWPGGGGSYAYADPAHGVAFALTKTSLVPDFDTVLSVLTIVTEHPGDTR